jgi:hypothetical protein
MKSMGACAQEPSAAIFVPGNPMRRKYQHIDFIA